MKKFLVGLVALIVLAGAGFWGVTSYAHMRAQSEVEAVFQGLRASGRTAQHGPVGFDLFAKTLDIPDISILEPDGASVRVGRIIAAGLSNPVKGRIGVRTIEASDIVVEIPSTPGRVGARYRVPRAVLEGYEGPDTLLPQEGRENVALRLVLKQLAATRAERLTLPEAVVRIDAAGKDGVATHSTYKDVVFENLDQGRIARAGFASMTFETIAPTNAPELAMKGRVEGLAFTGIDTAPVRALLEPDPKPGLVTLYEQVVARGYSLTRADASTMAVSSVEARGLALDPSRLSFARLNELQTLSQIQPPLNEDDTRRLMEASGDIVRAIGFSEISLKGVSVTEPTGKASVGLMRLTGQKDARLDRFDMEALTGQVEGEKPFSLDRLSLRGLNLLPVLELSARAPADEAAPTLDSALALFRALEGVEIAGLRAFMADSDAPVAIGAMKLDWGQFIGLVPTRFSFSGSGITGPISDADGPPFSYLAAAGAKDATLGFDTVLAFDPAAQTLRLSPASTRIETALAVDFDITLTKVRPEAFEDPIAALTAAQQIAVGPAKLVVTNLGIADVILKERATQANTTPEALRAETVAQIRAYAKELAPLFPEAGTIGDTLASFVEKPGTLTVTLTPLGEVKAMDLLAADPLTLVRDFKVTAAATP
ncbi:hypothetical protein [Aquabacter cavernae]|uniref:hypothetical protein n=1 Tax=Aquabacter cavernae TaxID=2496029 RepID=UPI000F8DEF00|nr:hypothetical protein [Aquabacter cavernae]